MANAHASLAALFTDIANAIRAKTGSTAQIVADSFPTAIAAIESGTDTSDATAAATDVRAGKTFYAAGEKKTGTVQDAAQATPDITVSTTGKITASSTQAAGFVAAGIKTADYYLSTRGASTITPGTSEQIIGAGVYLTGIQTIQGDSSLVPDNIKQGASIFGVSGSFTGAKSCASGTFKGSTSSTKEVEFELEDVPKHFMAVSETNYENLGLNVYGIVCLAYDGSGDSEVKRVLYAMHTANGDTTLYTRASDVTLELSASGATITLSNSVKFAAGVTYMWAAW